MIFVVYSECLIELDLGIWVVSDIKVCGYMYNSVASIEIQIQRLIL